MIHWCYGMLKEVDNNNKIHGHWIHTVILCAQQTFSTTEQQVWECSSTIFWCAHCSCLFITHEKTCLICCQSFRIKLKRAPWITWCSVCRRLRSGPTWTWRRSDTRHRSAAPSPGERSTVGVYTPRWPVSPAGTRSNWKTSRRKTVRSNDGSVGINCSHSFPTDSSARKFRIYLLIFFFFLNNWAFGRFSCHDHQSKRTLKWKTWHWLDR